MNVTCTWRFRVVAEDLDRVPAEVDSIMEEMLNLETEVLHSTSIGLDLDKQELEVSVSVEAETFERAVEIGISAIRTAIHAAGGSTPDWPSTSAVVEDGLRLIEPQLIAG